MVRIHRKPPVLRALRLVGPKFIYLWWACYGIRASGQNRDAMITSADAILASAVVTIASADATSASG